MSDLSPHGMDAWLTILELPIGDRAKLLERLAEDIGRQAMRGAVTPPSPTAEAARQRVCVECAMSIDHTHGSRLRCDQCREEHRRKTWRECAARGRAAPPPRTRACQGCGCSLARRHAMVRRCKTCQAAYVSASNRAIYERSKAAQAQAQPPRPAKPPVAPWPAGAALTQAKKKAMRRCEAHGTRACLSCASQRRERGEFLFENSHTRRAP